RRIECSGIFLVRIDGCRRRSRIFFGHITTLASPNEVTNSWSKSGVAFGLGARGTVESLKRYIVTPVTVWKWPAAFLEVSRAQLRSENCGGGLPSGPRALPQYQISSNAPGPTYEMRSNY